MCGKLQDIDDLDLIEGNYFCTYPYWSDQKPCAEQQTDYLQFMATRERPA